MNISKHPTLKRLYDIAVEHENLPPSETQTAISIVLSNAMEDIEKIVGSCDKTAENKEFSEMIEKETEQNIKHIQSTEDY